MQEIWSDPQHYSCPDGRVLGRPAMSA